METTIILMGVIALLLIISTTFGILFHRKVNELKKLRKEQMFDLDETNKLFLEKSENELKLFFQFEAAIEESIKISREIKSISKEKFKELIVLQDKIVKMLSNN